MKAQDLMAYILDKGIIAKNGTRLVRGGRVPDCPGVRYHFFGKKKIF